MKYITADKETEYLILLMRAAILGKETPRPQCELDHEKLLSIADKQQIYNIVLPALEQIGLLSDKEAKQWNDYRLSELQRTIVVNNERGNICRELEKQGINYMFLKGLVIRDYYPKSFMRQMSDNDILYDKNKRDVLIKIMKSNGFYLGTSIGASDDFYKKPFCTFEFHRELFSNDEACAPDFDLWKNAKQEENYSHRYRISCEDNYLYTICHLYKHYKYVDGCGIRFLCDIYLLLNSGDKLDMDYIDRRLNEFGIKDFNDTAVGLANALIKNDDCSDEQQRLLDFMLSGTVYGVAQDNVERTLDSFGGSKIKYLLYRIFPPASIMKGNYRKLEKLPWLLPVYYIIRLFDKLKHNKDKMKSELKKVNKL